MAKKKGITLSDVLAHIRGLRDEMNERFDGVDGRIDRLEQKVDGIDRRLIRMEESLVPSHQRLQITVRDHSGRIRRLEKKEGLVVV